ncbi:MAG: NAD(P)H-dependent glycerol-3-phosphate dehydrogenase [Casimicrobiaceae bacterium]
MTGSIAILGAGAWGTALGVHLARRGERPVRLFARDAAQATAMHATRVNARYLPGIALPSALVITARLDDVGDSTLLIAATPVAALPDLAAALARVAPDVPLFWLSKGLLAIPSTLAAPAGAALAHQVIAPRWRAPVGIISGPSFAEEVARGLPTALTVAATDPAVASMVAAALRAETLRTYVSTDLPGVEIGGAVKNVLAIAAGLCDGLGFGHNARAALVTRGLAETMRLAEAMGGQRETVMGLAGLGDLVLTCTGDLSRNRRVGLGLARGDALATVLESLGHVAEGVLAAPSVRALARHHAVDMPIVEAVDRVLHEGLAPGAAVVELLKREPRAEQS